jgi:hypothetical protein
VRTPLSFRATRRLLSAWSHPASPSKLTDTDSCCPPHRISQIKSSHIEPWQILFIIEGLPTCCIAFVAFYVLPDSLSKAKFLSDREKQIAAAAIARNQVADPDRGTGFQYKHVLAALKDPKSYIPGVIYFSCNVSFASLPLFVPTIISQMGAFTKIQSNGLSAPPYVLCFFMILLLTWLSDRTNKRAPFIIFASLVAAIGFIMQATCTGVVPRYVGVFLSVQVFCCVALTLAWVSNIHSTESKRAGGMTVLATLGQFGPLLGTNVSCPSICVDSSLTLSTRSFPPPRSPSTARACGSRHPSACSSRSAVQCWLQS